MSDLIILGIDPGIDTTGYGVIILESRSAIFIDAGLISNAKDTALEKKCHNIFSGVNTLIKKHSATIVILESVFSHPKFPQSALVLAHARGAVCTAVAHQNSILEQLEPALVKKCLTGNGRASKSQIKSFIQNYLRIDLSDAPYDVSDSLALALAYYFLRS